MRTGETTKKTRSMRRMSWLLKERGLLVLLTLIVPLGNNEDTKNNGKSNALRSKHSVTEQRRRRKINERFQILRDLIPHSDQKRDPASFLLEVIEYVQYLQEKVQKYEGSYQVWNGEPTKLIPWIAEDQL